MPNARELLEQADALMRRNRKRARDKGEGPPTLTDALAERFALAPTIVLPDAARADPIVLPDTGVADPIALDTLSDLPVLTDVVDVWPSFSDAAGVPAAGGVTASTRLDDAIEADAFGASASADERPDSAPRDVPSEPWPVQAAESGETSAKPDGDPHDTDGQSASARVADGDVGNMEFVGTQVSVPDEIELDAAPAIPLPDEDFILDIPPTDESSGSSANEPEAARYQHSDPSPAILPGSPDWNAMAEEIRMQVLQRLDLFTDTGMRDQLGAQLQPIVNRASAELVETINRELGELVRGYVADAIEREIESWRRRSDS